MARLESKMLQARGLSRCHSALLILQVNDTVVVRANHCDQSRPTEFIAPMCRNIKILFNFEPPVTLEEVRAASLQYVRKVTGFNKPSKANEAAFETAVDEIAQTSMRLLNHLETNAPPRNREEEAAKAKARSLARFGD
ncbi:MAG TPA: DUF2277 domain-containing protein [Terracidiphilus sp.]|nr:DUF2277 domain-containing protein [Terracidiphilus sp.]